MNNLLNGLVLCGGNSTRMGKDKSLINYHGKPQREYLIELLAVHCSEVFISAPRNSKATQSCIPDHFDLDSPLNAILSAFHFDPDSSWLTVPVDMPNINSKAIEYLLRYRNNQKLATCFFDSEGMNPEPLFTVWEARAKPHLFDFFNHGGISPRKFLMENNVCILNAPAPEILVNINTEEDLKAFFGQSGKTLQQGG